ncbi:4-methyl-5(B-hydroxyethyl)-thiazole monophosphate biosynthesis protein [Companilactobacillus kimchiensis]|uniref:4-methyl-5(B-hydroxyethyl)-thiazole monophosphate biosynthesis protein n=2 Tax=Companilactobacillus kimchiensis TaxID=993692 RepID=A0A0R2LBR8_9LACO|nr:4-methyl-5(B-hydroxyethyl)-thiazole monophosphate biosynthesis protein [Companilactobacillus kimchiensis]
MLNDYADWEGAYLSSQLNQNQEWTVKTASTQKEVTSIGGFKTLVDYQLNDILNQEVDLLVLIGGNSWSLENAELKKLIAERLANNEPVAAICGAVDYLAKNGLLTGYKHTGNAQYLWKDYAEYKNPTDFQMEQVVSDKNLVTSNGTAALEFTNLVLKKIQFTSNSEVDKITDLHKLGFYQYCDKYGNPFA